MKLLTGALALAMAVAGCGGGGGGGGEGGERSAFDLSNPYRAVISGVAFECASVETGPVTFRVDNSVREVAFMLPGEIILNTGLLATMPLTLQYFWVGHECAHHTYRPDTEPNADCVSIKTGKQRGLFTRSDIHAFEPWFIDRPGSTRGHLPGPERLQHLLACYDAG